MDGVKNGLGQGSSPSTTQHVHFPACKPPLDMVQDKIEVTLLDSPTKQREAQISIKLLGAVKATYTSKFINFGSSNIP